MSFEMRLMDEWILGNEEGKKQGIIQGRTEGIEEGRQQGRTAAIQEIVHRLARTGMSAEEIAGIAGISTEEVLALGEKALPDK